MKRKGKNAERKIMHMYTMLLLLLGAATLAVEADAQEAPTAVVPGIGVLTGTIDTFSGDAAFLGIPYALPPVGEFRLRPPRPVPRVAEGEQLPLVDATSFGNQCMQNDKEPLSVFEPDSPLSEDCLFLNVLTPAPGETDARLPVVLVIHGGFFTRGSSNEVAFLASTFAQYAMGKVIIVTINYRLGLWGFLGGKSMRDRVGSAAAGNLAILDQQLAMQWTKDHIAAFGGNPDEITLLGYSAGGVSARLHLALESSAHLFSRAVIQAGTTVDELSMDDADAWEEDVLLMAGCDDLDCLVALDSDTLAEVNRGFTVYDASDADMYSVPFGRQKFLREKGRTQLWAPVVDGTFIRETATETFRRGGIAGAESKQVIIGSNRDEYAIFFLQETDLTESQYESLLRDAGFNETMVSEIKDVYNPDNGYEYPDFGQFSRWWWQAIRGETDSVPGLGICAARYNARLLANAGFDVYAYHLEAPLMTEIVEGSGITTALSGHIFDLLFIFAVPFPVLTDVNDLTVSAQMSAFWLSFIDQETWPKPQVDMAAWPKYTIEEDLFMVFDVPTPKAQSQIREDACIFWERMAK